MATDLPSALRAFLHAPPPTAAVAAAAAAAGEEGENALPAPSAPLDEPTEVLFRRCLRHGSPLLHPVLRVAPAVLEHVPRELAERLTKPVVREVCVAVFDRIEMNSVALQTPDLVERAMREALAVLHVVCDRTSFFRTARFFFAQNGEYRVHTATRASPEEVFLTALHALEFVLTFGDGFLYDWRPAFRDLMVDDPAREPKAVDLCCRFAAKLSKAGCFEAGLRTALLRAMHARGYDSHAIATLVGTWSHERVAPTPTLLRECLSNGSRPACAAGAIVREAASPEDVMEGVVFTVTSQWRLSRAPPPDLLNAVEHAFLKDKSLFARFLRQPALMREALTHQHASVACRMCWVMGEVGSTLELGLEELLQACGADVGASSLLVSYALIGALFKYAARAPQKFQERVIHVLGTMPACFERDDALAVLTLYPYLAGEIVSRGLA